MTGKVYFLTGSNRGIELELVKKLSERNTNTIIATARDLSKATELIKFAESNKNVKLVTLDVSSEESIGNLDRQLESIAKDGLMYSSLMPQ